MLSGFVAFVNLNPGFEAREPWANHKRRSNPERVRQSRNPFRVGRVFQLITQGSRASNPGLKLANAFGVIQLTTTTITTTFHNLSPLTGSNISLTM